jgi:hypothetical protein
MKEERDRKRNHCYIIYIYNLLEGWKKKKEKERKRKKEKERERQIYIIFIIYNLYIIN